MKHNPKLGQNFLVDDNARHAIVNALGDITERTVIEIGPGHGSLTKLLSPRCRHLIVVELDRSLAAELRFHFRDQSHVEVVEGDILSTDIDSFLAAGETADVIGNLPYYITSDILLKLFAAHASLARAVLMMQREVADRVAARPGVRDYGLLSATTQMYAGVTNLFTLPPAAFNPPPDVHSTVLRLQFAPRFAELGVDAAGFDAFLKLSFAQKRKTLHNNLRAANYTQNQLAAWPQEVSPQARAESLSLEAMAALYHAVNSGTP